MEKMIGSARRFRCEKHGVISNQLNFEVRTDKTCQKILHRTVSKNVAKFCLKPRAKANLIFLCAWVQLGTQTVKIERNQLRPACGFES